jgi:hypothetical protein
MSLEIKARELQARLPQGGLFAGKTWLTAPEPVRLGSGLWAELEKLGKIFRKFYEVCDRLYLRGASGNDERLKFINRVLDAGKPPRLVEHARAKSVRGKLPRVIRPDLLLTDEGLRVTELDSVPGGIGVAAWLQQAHAQVNPEVFTGRSVLEAWGECFSDRDVIVSQESATYRPEMEWLAERTQGQQVLEAESFRPRGRNVYRFVECFDLKNMPHTDQWLEAAESGLDFSPPMRPHMEEKMWAAFLWLKPLEEMWRRELGEGYFEKLRQITPYTWMVNPEPLPLHAVLPELDVNGWEAVGNFSQKERRLVLKRSGFSEDAWGSRSVVVGHDVSGERWREAIKTALENWNRSPFVLQKFVSSSRRTLVVFDEKMNAIEMEARLRLCPYYFVMEDGDVQMTAVKVTAVPSDKKVIHGMEESAVTLASA